MRVIDPLNIFEKEGIVFLVQVDHVSGEVLGTAIEDLYQAGAYNVQVIATITKKNRPGHLFVIDCGAENCAPVEQVILHEIGATGWHKFGTAHRHVGTKIQVYDIVFPTPQGEIAIAVQVKTLKKPPHSLRPEHSSCLEVRQTLRECQVYLSLEEIRQEILKQICTK